MATATKPETAVQIVDQSPDAVVEWNLDNWPADQFNRLVPTQTLGLVTDLIRPVVQVVQLELERDTYSSNDLEEGHRAPNARGLAILAAAAGVDFPNEERMDDGSDPGRASAKAWATMVDGVGRTRTVVGSRDYVLASQAMTDRQRQRAKAYVYEHALTRARHRAMRVLLGLRQSYPVAELRKPFAVVSYVPNLQHPELREAYKQALLPTVAAMYGPGAAKQLTAGADLIDLDADEPKNVTPAPETPTKMPGEKLAKAGDDGSTPEEPAWMRGAPAATEAAPARDERLLEAIRGIAAEGGLKGPATGPHVKRLQEIFADVGGAAITPGLLAIWPELNVDELTANQANAIIVAADSDPEFVDHWRELAS